VRWSQAFIPTLRDDPADAEAASHRLLVRAGYIRQLMAGSYSILPLGMRVCHKISRLVREEMDAIGAQEFLLPCLHPAELWQRSGRWERIGEEMFRLRDRRQADLALGVTHEEVFTAIACELRSYRQLPQIWYQIQSKFRDEPRPKSGLLRVREFSMKDSYSFDVDPQGLDLSFQKHFEAYRRIFSRCGVDTIAVEASSGNMGGSESIEFMVPSDAGEDWIASCGACGYAANLEKATSGVEKATSGVEKATSGAAPVPEEKAAAAGEALGAPQEFATPGVRSIEDLARFAGGAPAERQIKALVYALDGAAALVLLRGDQELAVQKLADATGAGQVRPASDAEIRAALGASAGSLGAVGVRGLRVLADRSLEGASGMWTGANRDGFHLRGVDVARDIRVDAWLDLRQAKAGEACPACEAPLAVRKTIEVGHIFKLGTRYSEALGALFLDEEQKARPIWMGSYGIGIGRAMAAVAEASHDDAGLVWPTSVAPFEVVITAIDPKRAETADAANGLYDALRARGVDTLLDDRSERPGVKFNDADLIGIPYRITVGPKGLAEGRVEWTRRRTRESRNLDLHKAPDVVAEAVIEERSLTA